MKTRVSAALLGVLALLIGIAPMFTSCRTTFMVCHWTARAELVLAVPLLSVAVLLALSRHREARVDLGILGAILGVLVIILPTAALGVCTSAMNCRTIMRPVLILMGSLVVAVSLVCTTLSARQK